MKGMKIRQTALGILRRHRGLAAMVRRMRPISPGRTDPDRSQARADLRQTLERAFHAFLADGQRMDFTPDQPPRISVLIILYNQAALTFGCLDALQATGRRDLQLIIVDNASSDRTDALLAGITGATIIPNGENLHFLRAVNQGAEQARGEYLLLLNNDAFVAPDALDKALMILDQDPAIGAVGAKIVLPDGLLQEAGSILWNDGSALGYGRGQPPEAAPYQFQRVVDYCSGAFLLIRRALFEALGRLDLIFAPAYYEETDLCLRMARMGHPVIYDPRIVVRHMEFASSASSADALALQTRNRAIFLDRHQAELARHYPPTANPLQARDRRSRPRILVIDDCVPFEYLGAGMPRASCLLRALDQMDIAVSFFPRTNGRAEWPEIWAHFPPQIEFMIWPPDQIPIDRAAQIAERLPRAIRKPLGHVYRAGRRVLARAIRLINPKTPIMGDPRLEAFLRERHDFYDTIIVSRPHNMRVIADLLERKPDALGKARLIYDAEALIAPREAMRLALEGRPLSPLRLEGDIQAELDLAKPADLVFAVNEIDAAHFRAAGPKPVVILGHALAIAPTPARFIDRRGFLFVGALEVDDSPNTDSLRWFVAEVAAHLNGLLGPDWHLDVVGRTNARRAQELASPNLHLHGATSDLDAFYDQARVFIAPTRYAAGIPHKVHEAAAHGLPVVATALLARQLGWENGVELLVADTPLEFARQMQRLHDDPALWQNIRAAALARVAQDCSLDHFSTILAQALEPKT